MIAWIFGLTAPLFELFEQAFSWRDLILIAGGLFLLYKGTREIHERLEGEEGEASARVPATFAAVVAQIAVLDIVFSLDSVITAVGMADHLWIMVAAVAIAVAVMLVARPGQRLRRAPPDGEDGAELLLLIGMTLGRRLRRPHPEGLHLRRHGLLGLVEASTWRRARRRAAADACACPPVDGKKGTQ
jgi:predicted tellurium resistance membrane protein TerC